MVVESPSNGWPRTVLLVVCFFRMIRVLLPTLVLLFLLYWQFQDQLPSLFGPTDDSAKKAQDYEEAMRLFEQKYPKVMMSTDESVYRARHAPDWALPLGDPIPNFTSPKGKTYYFKSIHVNDMSQELMDWAFSVLEKNMRQMYEESEFGWDGERKRKEMLDPYQRFLIAFDASNDQPAGFMQYQFLPEDTAYGHPIPVIYCWEIMVAEHAQGHGIGWQFMRMMEKLGRAWDMEKAMLTVFTHNPKARAFYDKLGYVPDEISPSMWGMEKDYEIMSIRLRPSYESAESDDETVHGEPFELDDEKIEL